MTWWRIFAAILAFALIGAIGWAILTSGELHGDIWQQGGVILTLPWGVVAMLDLYVGFALMAMIMMLAERSFVIGILWALPMLALGNVWAAIWLIVRLPSLSRRLTAPDWPSG
ncbi:MAG: hypothetical protein ACOYM8_01865 [Caulobacterales bacterium]|jgi:hypothetical protein